MQRRRLGFGDSVVFVQSSISMPALFGTSGGMDMSRIASMLASTSHSAALAASMSGPMMSQA
jgi:hypothetical protein